jgi:hypothetical protein
MLTRPFSPIAIFAALALLAGIGHGYSTHRSLPAIRKSSQRSSISSSTSSSSSSVADVPSVVNRGSFLSHAATACLALILPLSSIDVPRAHAKDVDPALKGTKADPAFQGCLSECVYECTKPKGTEQKSRAECIPECKVKCATSKAQLMLGTAK